MDSAGYYANVHPPLRLLRWPVLARRRFALPFVAVVCLTELFAARLANRPDPHRDR
jgi:hypothetical protein